MENFAKAKKHRKVQIESIKKQINSAWYYVLQSAGNG